jgi:hypothetical protein
MRLTSLLPTGSSSVFVINLPSTDLCIDCQPNLTLELGTEKSLWLYEGIATLIRNERFLMSTRRDTWSGEGSHSGLCSLIDPSPVCD